MDVIGGYEDYTAGKGHGVPAQHCTRVLVTDGAGYTSTTICHWKSPILCAILHREILSNQTDSWDNGHRCQREKGINFDVSKDQESGKLPSFP